MSRDTFICFVVMVTIQIVVAGASREGLKDNYDMDPTVIVMSNEINLWMSQPEQNFSNMPIHIRQLISSLNNTNSERQSYDPTERIFSGPQTFCSPCELLASVVVGYSRIGGSINILSNFLVKICYIFVYKSTQVCKGLIYQDKDRLNYIIRNSDVSGEALCSLALGSQGCGPFKGPSWNVHIPLLNPFVHHLDDRITSQLSAPQLKQEITSTREANNQRVSGVERSIDFSGINIKNLQAFAEDERILYNPHKKILKVLHLTDPHYDPQYKVGSNAVCEAPLCCNKESGRVKNPADAAGKWGDYRNCDSPRWLLENMFEHIATTHPDIDYIMCTGDIVPHHIWKINKYSNINVLRDVTNMVIHYFPNIPVYGAIGNHESFPRDSFPPPELPEIFSKFGNQWLYDSATDNWERLQKRTLPSSARYAGYYSILIRPRFRLISINTNFCYILNWWVLFKPVDPGNVLKWLVQELEKAEMRMEFVHIIGHIPPLYIDCYDQWAHQFSRIVSRFSHIIRGQFYGHSHLDEFRIHYDVSDPKTPVGIEYISPNNGPFTNLNPSYRIYYIEGDHAETTRDVLDYETYVMNLTHANLYDDPKWFKLYSAREDLQLPNLLPSSWDAFTRRLAQDPFFFYKYYRYQMQASDPAIAQGCNYKCRKQSICSIVEGDVYLPKKCRHK